ncbi:hypothetical protein KDK_79680 [Dictyobacter kobayashii]|uniref:Uncharacterized protein n=1 Tax=Dictyobacter kobayashii TaxID=2014872 RepID=A0A402AYL6_9CHLR|nr:hypothetical protein KDK_79680 [Dictyobacter kobayashii]
MIDSRSCSIEHHHRVGTYKWEVSQYEDRQDTIQLESLEISLPVSEVYFKVYLETED